MAVLQNGHMHDTPSTYQTRPFISLPSTSYPTGCLHFLHDSRAKQRAESSRLNGVAPQKQSNIKLNIIVAGAGLGGLATAIALSRKGHTVTVFEQAAALAEVGAGIQIPANSARLLLRWGIEPYLKAQAVEPEGISFRRWQSGAIIGYTKLVPDFRRDFSAPYYVIHRAHFHSAMHELALSLGVTIRVNAKVVDYDGETPSLRLANGEVYTADLIVGSDGIKSLARSKLLGVDFPTIPTGFAAYRATVSVAQMREDPKISWLLDKPGLNIWIGDQRHVMTYTIAGGNAFNMVLSHPESSDPSTWNHDSALQDMRRHFDGWDPTLTRIIRMIEKTMKWPLLTGSKSDHWVTPSGKCVILGDAAHAMVPYMSQGAAMAVEDGAALAIALDQLKSRTDLTAALHVFERVRIERTTQMQDASMLNGTLWHFADGPEQEARDAAMRLEVERRPFTTSPNQWSDPTTQLWCYGYDAEEAMQRAFDEMRSGTIAFVN